MATKKSADAAVAPKLVVERVLISELKPDPKNARLHPQRNLESIRESLTRYGQQKPIVVMEDGTVVAGNGTLEAATELGWSHLDIVRTKLTGKAAAAFAIADNRTAELAEWDLETLMGSIKEIGPDDIVGFSQDELDEITETLSGAGGSGGADATYSSKIESPLYVPKLDTPPLESALVSTAYADGLAEKIKAANITDEAKSFLLKAAARHYQFDYGMIAEYYAHATPELQDLMEQSALVIVDFNKAVEHGFVKMTESMSELVTGTENGDVDETELV